MSANGISRLTYKRDRQEAKLSLAAIDRAASGKRSIVDLAQLPTLYGADDNSPGAIINNPNTGGLIEGRPWISVPPFSNPEITAGVGVSVQSFSPFSGGGNSYQFAGDAASYLSFAGSDDWAVGTSDFTIEWFSYQTSIISPQFQRIFTVGDFPAIKIGASIESSTFYYWANNAFRYSSVGASSANAWIHWVIVRASGVTKIYRNGIQLGSQINDSNNITDNITSLVIGNTNTYAANAALVGYLTNFRWVKGFAVYTGNFTVPTNSLTAVASANPFGGDNTQAIPEGLTKLLLIP